jgi:hypothetical protein
MPCVSPADCENVNCGAQQAECAQLQCACPVDVPCVNAIDGVPCLFQNASMGPSGTCFDDECLGNIGTYGSCGQACTQLFGFSGEVSIIKGYCDCKAECGLQAPPFGMLLECQNSLVPMAPNPSVCPSLCPNASCEPIGNTGMFQVSCNPTPP